MVEYSPEWLDYPSKVLAETIMGAMQTATRIGVERTSRELSQVITKLEESLLWLKRRDEKRREEMARGDS